MKSKLVPVRAVVATALIAAFAMVLLPASPAYAVFGQPTVSHVSPNAGPTAGGQTVTITGTNFLGLLSVHFGSTLAPGAVVSNQTATQITVVSPAGSQGTVDVTVTTNNGTSINNVNDRYTYIPPAPQVTSVSPTSGPQVPPNSGFSVTINGSNFAGATEVDFGSLPAPSFTVNTAGTQIIAKSPTSPSPQTVDITVTTQLGGPSTVSSADHYTFVGAPTVTSINPTGGSTAGGTVVDIAGTNFVGVTGASAVKFGSNAAASYTVNSDTSITATSPAGSAGAVDVTVTGTGGTSATSTNDQFTYVNAPVVSKLTPTGGSTAGGTAVVITGSGFTGADSGCSGCGVMFGSVAASSFTVKSPTEIDAVSPAESAGAVHVHVTTAVGTNTDVSPNSDVYTYVSSGPHVLGVNPVAGTINGGTVVTVSGVGLTGATGVAFGATCVSSGITVNSDNQITVASPSHTAGTVDVEVTVNGVGCTNGVSGQTSPANPPADQFTFVAPPTVTSINPTSGPAAGGTTVTVNGSNFGAPNNVPTVMFGSNAATSVHVVSGSQLTAVSPAGADVVDVVVTTQYGGSSNTGVADQFTYGPTVDGVNPNKGPTAGGTSVTITGTGFNTGGTPTVDFGANPATNVHVVDDFHLTADSPAQGAESSSVDVTVTTGGGTSPQNSPADVFEWVPAPTVTSVSPTFGSTQGGDTVTITGTNFDFTSMVEFGAGNAAPAFTVDSATQITATSPSGSPSTVDVLVTTPGGTSAVNHPGDQFQYVAVPTVASVSPSSGARSGGTTVTVTGSGFTESPNPTVDFGSTPATGVNVVNDSQLTAVSPAGSVGTVDVTVTNIGGTSPTSPADHFSYTPEPVSTVTAFPGGIVAGYGPQNVTIYGFGFQPGATVTINNPGVSVAVNSVGGNQISTTMNTSSASASAASVGPSVITVHNPDGGTATINNFVVAASGYYTTTQAGTVSAFGSVPFAGDLTGVRLNKPIVGMAATPDGNGYWLVASDGGIFTFGDAGFYGSEGGAPLNKPIVGMAATPSGHGYWLVASDGGIFTHGDAGFFGSEGGVRLNKPVVGMAPTRDGRGYWLVATDGGIFTHGDAAFLGSEGGVALNKPVVGMEPTASGQGYWLVASDGGVFTHGDAPFVGSLGSVQLNSPIMGMAPSLLGTGYYLLGGDGGVFTFNVPFYGSSPTGGAAAAITDVARVR